MNWRWMVGLRQWSGNEGPVIPMEVTWFSTTKEGCSKIKTMLTVFFDWEGVVHHNTLLQAKQWIRSTTSVFSVGWNAWLKWPQLHATGDWRLHHDNAPTHPVRLVQFLVKHQITQVTQPPDSPDLVCCDFWLFLKLKSPLKGKRFQTVNKIQENMTGQLIASGRTVWGPKIPTLKGTEASFSYAQCFLYLVSSSINVYFSHSMAEYFLDRPGMKTIPRRLWFNYKHLDE